MNDFRSIDGVNISFLEYNKGRESTIIIINSIAGNTNLTKSQAEHLSKLGYHVISISLCTYIEDRQVGVISNKLSGFAILIMQLLQAIGIEKATIIGLNHGGHIAIEIVANNPSLVSHLIILNSPLLMPAWMRNLVLHYAQGIYENIENDIEDLLSALVVGVKQEDKDIIINSYASIPKKALAAIYEDLIKWDETSNERLKKCQMPFLYVETQNSTCSNALLKKLCPHVAIARVISFGIWVSLEAEAQVNAAIEHFLNISYPASTSTLLKEIA